MSPFLGAEMMRMNRALLGAAVAVVLPCAFVGCDSSSAEQKPQAVSPEVQKKTDEMLKNYGQQYGEQYKAKKAAKK
jgi:hypothetical protein